MLSVKQFSLRKRSIGSPKRSPSVRLCGLLGKVRRNGVLSKEDLHSHLKNCGISDEDYEHAQNVRTAFDMRNIGEYFDPWSRPTSFSCLTTPKALEGLVSQLTG
jgi:hypothetical protein